MFEAGLLIRFTYILNDDNDDGFAISIRSRETELRFVPHFGVFCIVQGVATVHVCIICAPSKPHSLHGILLSCFGI